MMVHLVHFFKEKNICICILCILNKNAYNTNTNIFLSKYIKIFDIFRYNLMFDPKIFPLNKQN